MGPLLPRRFGVEKLLGGDRGVHAERRKFREG